ncbi:MAG: hypothetical protein QNJ97_04860 [Myxococcota bacterium]|nr:hypothetical protein [Myxococcota bacterium]
MHPLSALTAVFFLLTACASPRPADTAAPQPAEKDTLTNTQRASTGKSVPQPETKHSLTGEPMADLLLSVGTHAVLLNWQASTGTYSVGPHLNIGDTYPKTKKILHQLGNAFFILTDKSIVKTTSDLKRIAAQTFDGEAPTKLLGAAATDGRHLFVSAQGDFIVLDAGFKELGRVPLDIGDGKTKSAHDLLIRNQIAYALDNIMRPIYAFMIDVSDPEKPGVIDRRLGQGVNLHLDDQWVTGEPPRWYIKATYALHSGWGQYVLVPEDTPKSDMLARLGALQVKFAFPPSAESPPSGLELLSLTRTDPAWAVLCDVASNRNYLAKSIAKPGNDLFEKIDVVDFGNKNDVLRFKDGLLYFITKARDCKSARWRCQSEAAVTLRIIDVRDFPTKLLVETQIGVSLADTLKLPENARKFMYVRDFIPI